MSRTNQFRSKKDSNIELSQLMLPTHANFNGKVHGGYVLELMDQVAFACASKHSGAYCVTAGVEAVNFLRPIEVGELLSLKASVNYVGDSSMIVGMRVEAENIRNGKKKHCNSSYFTMVAKNDQGESISVPGLILENEEDIKRFLRCVRRKELREKHQKQFEQADLNGQIYREKLNQHRVKILK